MSTNEKPIFKRNITKSQCKDAGMAFILIFVLTGLFYNKIIPFKTEISGMVLDVMWPFKIAVFGLLIDMIWPVLFKPFAWFWYNFAELLGGISSKIVLTIVFFTVVTPVGLLRRLTGKDRLLLKSFKKNRNSVFHERNHEYKGEDLEQPF